MEKSNLKIASIPMQAPLYGAPPYIYPSAELIQVVFNVNRNEIESIVPNPLKIARSPMIMAYVAFFQDSTVGPYHEAAAFVDVKLKTEKIKIRGWFCTNMFVDSDRALTAGREIWGFPKKLAEMSIRDKDGCKIGLLKRNGKELMKIQVKLEHEFDELPMEAFNSVINLKQILSPDGNSLELSEFVLSSMEIKPKRMMGGSASIEFNWSEEDPLYLFEPKTKQTGLHVLADGILTAGRVIHKRK
ncbi:MAG: acetoacetate decarboxylase family protein [Candidatus Helarchaeota archaeon]